LAFSPIIAQRHEPRRSGATTAPAENSRALPRSAPERQGVSSSDILTFVEAADKEIDAMHSFMLVRHGHVVAEGWWGPFDAKTPHILYSLSKSFTSTAVGLAIAEGKFSLDDEVLKFFPEDAPAEEERCAVLGVFAPLVGIIGATQAAEALKLIAGAGDPLVGRLLLLDALTMEWRSIRLPRDPACAVCSRR